MRYVRNGRYNTPGPDTFRSQRDYVNQKLKLLPQVDYLLVIAGKYRLDPEGWYKDGVHFKTVGLQFQLNLLLEKLEHILAQG